MAKTPERLRTARLTIPPEFSDPALAADHQVHVVNLSPEGACIEHIRSLPEWGTCFFALPRVLGDRWSGAGRWAGNRRPRGSGRCTTEAASASRGSRPNSRAP